MVNSTDTNTTTKNMNQRNLAFTKTNFILIAIGVAIVVIGFILMAGGRSTEEQYNPEIFSAMRIKVAPIICLAGFLFMIFAVIFHRKGELENKETQENTEK